MMKPVHTLSNTFGQLGTVTDKEFSDGTDGTYWGNDGAGIATMAVTWNMRKYTVVLDIVYEYKFEYSGTITVDTTTTWSSSGQATTTVELTDSIENIPNICPSLL